MPHVALIAMICNRGKMACSHCSRAVLFSEFQPNFWLISAIGSGCLLPYLAMAWFLRAIKQIICLLSHEGRPTMRIAGALASLAYGGLWGVQPVIVMEVDRSGRHEHEQHLSRGKHVLSKIHCWYKTTFFTHNSWKWSFLTEISRDHEHPHYHNAETIVG